MVRMDQDAMTLVLLNLVDNAVKYGAARGHLTVKLARTPGGLALSVRDRGAGIAADEQQRIFERFYRASNARARNVRGSGIGLSLVKNIVQGHHASLITSSGLAGKGLSISVYFPGVVPPPAPAP